MRSYSFVTLVLAVVLLLPQDDQSARIVTGTVEFTDAELVALFEMASLPEQPADPTNAVYESESAARLGQALFFDERLSATGEVSCATCHDPAQSWADGKQVGEGIAKVVRNTPALWNVAYNRWFFWDGRRDSLWSQAITPLEDPREHGTSRLAVAHLIHDDPDYRRAYLDVFGAVPELTDGERFPPEGRPISGDKDHPQNVAWRSMSFQDRDTINRVFANVGKAIAAFQRQIVSRNSPFDVFVRGVRSGNALEQRSLSDAGRRGAKLFLGKARCHLCHTGPNFTDLEFHHDRVPPVESGNEQDLGRYSGIAQVENDPFNGIGRYSDDPTGEAEAKVGYLLRNSHNLMEFKTPTLRNVATTAPYMHAGQFATLTDVIEFYSTLEMAAPPHKGGERLLVPVHLTLQEKQDLEEFLTSLTDTSLPPALLRAPDKPYLDD
jgi:cytochrome c peroxidase